MPATVPLLVGGRLRRATAASAADLADAVVAARAALPGWSGVPADERARVLFGVAELLDGSDATAEAVDRWLWYAGWPDKLAGLLGSADVADGAAGWSAARPVGVVGAVAPPSPLGLVDVLAPALVAGATAVVVAAHGHRAAALVEALAASDLPAGAANVLTGDLAVLAPALAGAAVDGLDPGDAPLDPPPGTRGPGPGDPGVARLRAWSATTTVWLPAGR